MTITNLQTHRPSASHAYRLDWRGQAFKIDHYFQTYYWTFIDTASNIRCHYILMDKAMQKGSDKLWEQIKSLHECGARLYIRMDSFSNDSSEYDSD